MVGAASPTRQASRHHVQTPKARELNMRQLGMESSDTEDAIEVMDTSPAAPQAKHTEISTHLRDRIATTKVRALAARADRSAATTSNYAPQEKGSTNAQIKALTNLIKTLIKGMEDQKQTHRTQMEALMGMHENQIGTTTKVVTQQIDTITEQIDSLKAEVTDIAAKTEQIESQLSSIQVSSPSPSYAVVARTPPNSWPSNIQTLTSMGTTLSRMTDTLYCTIDMSRVGEDDKDKAQPGPIRKAVEEEIRTMEGHGRLRCAAVIKDGRNTERIKIACRDEEEHQRVKEAAQKVGAEGTRVLRDQLYPVKVDNANRSAVLDAQGKVLPGAAEALGKKRTKSILPRLHGSAGEMKGKRTDRW
jgi:hypothetical protein